MSFKLPSNVTRMGDATVIRDEDASNPVAVRFDHVTKQYKLFKNDKLRLLSTFSKRIPHDTVNASDDLSFTVNRGESLALLGDNGAGKSTALKMITGVCFPTSGTVEVHGRVSALLELSAGFDMKLSGMENIDMRCQLWGLSKEESKELIPEIVEFSELGKYIDQPMRTYSSGMRAVWASRSCRRSVRTSWWWTRRCPSATASSRRSAASGSTASSPTRT